MAQTDKQTDIHPDGHGNSMTESAKWGQFSENSAYKRPLNLSNRLLTNFLLLPDCLVCLSQIDQAERFA